jgi:hypothetical protein
MIKITKIINNLSLILIKINLKSKINKQRIYLMVTLMVMAIMLNKIV